MYYNNYNLCIFVEKFCYMNEGVLNSFSLTKVKELFLTDEIISIGDDFILAYQGNNADYELLRYPCRIDGYIAAFCSKGHFKCSINLTDYEVGDGMLILNIPDNIIKLEPIINENQKEAIELVVIAVSPKFMQSIRFDLNKLLGDALKILKNPCLKLLSEEIEMAKKYMQLIHSVYDANPKYMKDSVASLISSIFYLFGSFVDSRLTIEREEEKKTTSSRHKRLFEQFIALVTEHHGQERSVGFYADKLCITPKYLSKIIKNVSNMSAPEWIDNYVILEAEHLLRHSDLSVKMIADRLNFPSQSFFFKYFKSHTGFTPKQYREM